MNVYTMFNSKKYMYFKYIKKKNKTLFFFLKDPHFLSRYLCVKFLKLRRKKIRSFLWPDVHTLFKRCYMYMNVTHTSITGQSITGQRKTHRQLQFHWITSPWKQQAKPNPITLAFAFTPSSHHKQFMPFLHVNP